MAWTRRLYQSRTTYMLSVPHHVVAGMGIQRGDLVRLEHPFSDALIVTPLHGTVTMKSTEEMRALGWLTGGGWNLVQLLAVGAQTVNDGVECDVCKRWASEYKWCEVRLCRFCAREIEAALSFRRRPVQGEMELLMETVGRQGLSLGVKRRVENQEGEKKGVGWHERYGTKGGE